MQNVINFSYVLAAMLFILGIKMMGKVNTAKIGNFLSGIGMSVALVATLLDKNILSYNMIIIAIVLGSAIGAISAYRVQMVKLPEMVALLNSFGGIASLLVAMAEFHKISIFGWRRYFEMCGSEYSGLMIATTNGATFAAIAIGAITFTGSIVAYLKLSGKMRNLHLSIGKTFNMLLLLVLVTIGGIVIFEVNPSVKIIYTIAGLALFMGITLVLPIGGGDMPVIISLLNSLSGLAAAATGFIMTNIVLIVAGCLVGTSGFILTMIMCKAMNRNLKNVLFSGFGSRVKKSDSADEEPKEISVEDAYYVFEAAKNIMFIPGYGMAVAQAQHVTREFGQLLENNGADVKYAIHPVAGRMPGHMNVLLAEADVPYDQLIDMDTANDLMPNVDVAVVIGANDVVNVAAREDKDSPIYGMPIINAYLAKTVFVLKRGSGTGFSGIQNKLFTKENVRMIYGDAKKTISSLIANFKENK